MLLILERDQFIKLFKFGEIKVSVNRFIDGYDVENGKSGITKDLLDAKMPLFEQDHEVLILEIPKENVIIGTDISIKISSVRKIFPLTEEANKYLIGRMYPSIVIQKPVFESIVNEIKRERDFNLRLKAWDALALIFKIEKSLVKDYIEEVKEGIRARLSPDMKYRNKKYFHNLICFNRNPIYPQGNVEYLLKAGSVFVQMKDGSESVFENGNYYKFIESSTSEFFKLNLGECIELLKVRAESKLLIDELTKQYPRIDALTVGAYFLYFRDILNKNNFDLERIKDEVNISKVQKPVEIAIVLLMIGMFFNFDILYSSLYELKPIPIFNKDAEPIISEQNKILKNDIKELGAKSDQLKGELDRKEKFIEELKHNFGIEANTLKDLQKHLSVLIESARETDPELFGKLKEKKSGILDISFIKDFIQELKVHIKEPKHISTVEKEELNVLIENASDIIKTINSEVECVAAEIIYDQTTLKDIPVSMEYSSDEHHKKVAESDEIEKSIINDLATESLRNRAELDDQSELMRILDSGVDEPSKGAELIENPDESNLNRFPSKVKPNLTSESKSKLKKPKAETQSKKGSVGKLGQSSVSLTKDFVVNPTFQFQELDPFHYYEVDLAKIVQTVKEKGIISKPNEVETFEEAIMSYSSNKGAFQHNLLGEIEELQNQLNLDQEIVDKIQSIIIRIKE